jgi:predicted ATP-dependent endonuclease of OLD family/signal peptidase I
MRLSRVIIRRFKSIDELEIQIPEKDDTRQGSADFVSIVGENNVGKSTIMEAIRMACPGSTKPTLDHFPNLQLDRGPIEVEFEFNRLTEVDKKEQAIRPYVFMEKGVEKYRVMKRWETAAAPKHYVHIPNSTEKRFRDFPDGVTKKELEKLGDPGKEVIRAAEDEAKKGTKITKKEAFLQAAISINSSLVEDFATESSWSANPGGTAANLDTVLPKVIYVPALRETKDITDVSKAQSPVRAIVKALFEQQLSKHDKVTAFKNAAKGVEQLFDVEGKHKIVAHVESRLTSKLKELIDISAELQFEAPDVTSDLASQTELRIRHDGVLTKPEQQGHGAQRSIVLALLQVFAEQLMEGDLVERSRTLFLVEEPEIYMHPGMCRRMRDALLKIAQSGVGQVICTTHSPVFLDLADRHDGIVIVKRNGGAPFVTQRIDDVFEHNENDREQRARLRMLLSFDPVANEVFFADSVCLVEGDCEVAAIDATARKLHELKRIDWPTYLSVRRSVAIVNCRGKWTILAFQKVLRAFDIRYRVVHDEDTAIGPKRANDHIGNILTDEDQRRVHVPDFEQHVFGEPWTRDKPWKATIKIRDAADVDPRLVEFFEFVLGKKIEQLCQSDDDARAAQSIPPPASLIPRRDGRAELKKLDIPKEEIQRAQKLEQVFRIAAGPSFTPDVTDGAQAYRSASSHLSIFARIKGDSMADTLLEGDIVALEMLDDVHLWPVTDSADKSPKGSFCERIEDMGIYVLAINDDYDQRAYTAKRVRVHELVGGGWICQICADNPDAGWGERGLKEIRKSDHVHFRAKVVGLVNQNNDAEPAETEIVPIADT